jgi:hypothetical protein
LWANVEVYADLMRKTRLAPSWRDKLLVWLKPPGWRPARADASVWPATAFDVGRVRRYDPPTTLAARWFATLWLVLSIFATLPLLWFADGLPMRTVLAWAFAVVVTLWLAGAVLQRRLAVAPALGLQIGAIAGAIVCAVAG